MFQLWSRQSPRGLPLRRASTRNTRLATPNWQPQKGSKFAGVGTPVASDGLTATLEVTQDRAGPVDLILSVTDEQGEPLAGANVAITWEMPGMGDGRTEARAEEVAPGHYQVAAAQLDMAGEWTVSARISPKQQPTRIKQFVVELR